MRIIIPLFLLFQCSGSFSQITYEKGYIITLKGDTIHGEIKLNPKREVDFFSKVYFKVSETDKKLYKPNKIKEYNIRGQSFISKELYGEKIFLRRATVGAINLYEYEFEEADPTQDVMLNFEYYVQKSEQGELIKIKETKFKKQLAELMSDNEEILNELHDKNTGYDKIVEIVKKYNQGS